MRYMFIEDNDNSGVTSRKSQGEPAVIPPFTFTGRIRPSIGSPWCPPSSIILNSGYVHAKASGDSLAGFAIMKSNFFPGAEPIVIGSVLLSADRYRVGFQIGTPMAPVVVTPAEWIYVVSFASSGHEGIVIQLVGEYFTG